MRLQKGDTAPDFSIKDINGKTISLQDYKNEKTLLVFLRYAGCPFCNLVLKNIIHQLELLDNSDTHVKSDTHVVVFFQSPKEHVKSYPGKQNPSFPLVADPDKTVYDLYKVESSVTGLLKGATKLPLFYDTLVREKFHQGKIDGDIFLMPAYFMINESLKIVKAHYGVNFADQDPIIQIGEFIHFD